MITPVKTINEYVFGHFATDQVRGMIRNRMMLVTLDHSDDLKIPLDKIAGRVVSFKEKDGVIQCEWEPYPTPNGKIAKKLGKNGHIRPIGLGIVNNTKISEYKLLYVVVEK